MDQYYLNNKFDLDIILYIVLGILVIFALVPPSGKRLQGYCYFLVGFFLILMAGLWDGSADHLNYVDKYYEVITHERGLIEVSFVLISFISYFLVSDYFLLFLIYAIIGVLLKLLAIKKMSDLWFLSLIIYLSNFYILQEMTQIRVGVATGFFLLSIKYIYERNKYRFFLCFLGAFFFHYSSLIMLPIWFLSSKPNKKILMFSIPIAYLIYFIGFNIFQISIPIPDIQDKLDMYNSLQGLGTDWMDEINVFNFVFLAKVLIFYVMLWKYNLLERKNIYFPLMFKVFCISLFVFPALATFPVAAFRVSEFYGVVEIILYPMLIYITKPTRYSIPVVVLLGTILMIISQKNLLIN